MTADAPAPPNPPETVSCRPPAVNWVFVVLCAPVGLMAWFGAHNPSKSGPPSAAEVVTVQTFAVALLMAAIVLAVWQMRARIVSDADGLRWRRVGGWRSARWEDVQDYYDQRPVQAYRQRNMFSAVVRTTAGTVRFSSDWTNAGAMRAQVTRRAKGAAVDQWDMLGTRPCDPWPRIFRYDTWQNIWTPRILLKLVLSAFVYVLAKPLMQMAGMAGQMGWGVTLAMGGVYVLLVGSMGLPVFLVFAQYHAAGRRRAEHITADTDGIVFEDGARRVQADWQDVTGYQIVHGPGALTVRYVVETRQGEFDFLAAMSGALLLKAIIQRYAANAADKEWRARVDPEALGGAAARWSGGRAGGGARVYHYRTRSNRAMLGLPLGICLTMGFVCWATWQGLTPGTSFTEPVCAAFSFGLLFLACWYAYRVCRIETDEDGLTRITPLGRRRLAWDQVEDYWLTAEGGGVIAGRGEQIGFRKEIVGGDELKEGIARRATGCGGRRWERQPTTTAPTARRRGRRGRGWSGRG